MPRRAKHSNVLIPSTAELPRDVARDSTDTDPLRQYLVPVAEAEALVRKARGRTFYLYANQFAVSPDQNGVPEGSTRGKEVSANVITSKAYALQFLDSAYGRWYRDKGYLVKLTFNSHCFFIG